MSTAAIRQRSGRAPDASPSSGSGRWLSATIVVAAIGLLAAWWLGLLGTATDPRIAEIYKMRDDMAANYRAEGGPSNLAEATAMMASMAAIRQKIDALPEHLRAQAERGDGSMFRASMKGRIDAYFNAPPDKRDAVLDRQIDQEEWIRKAYEATQAVTAAVGGGAASGGNAGPPQAGPRRISNEDDRNRFRKGIIDRTSPAERARYVEYRRATAERREKRGLPPSPWGR